MAATGLASGPSRTTGSRPRRRLLLAGILGLAFAVLVAVAVLSLAIGARDVPFGTVFDALFAPAPGDNDQLVVRELRIPRTLIGMAAGIALGFSGTIMQGITRNPLADPGLLGVNAGASLFAVIAISWFGITSASGFVWFAFGGAAVAAALVYAIASVGREGATPLKLALAGAALTAVFSSFITLALLSDLDTLSVFRFWTVGSLAGRDLATLVMVLPYLLLGVVLAAVSGRMLNALSLGDDLARSLGQSVPLARGLSMAAIVLLCGGATAIAGPLVFVGLAVPHLARWITGPDYRWILAYSAVLGPLLLLAADVLGRIVARPGEVEAGIVVAVLGAPLMISIVRRVKLSGL